MKYYNKLYGAAMVVLSMLAVPASADVTIFSTGSVTNSMATATRPDSTGKFEIESADDFFLTGNARIDSATFTGLLTGGATVGNIGEVRVEIYRVFPADSNVGRTSGPPTFSTTNVPTRVNSPSDVELDDRDTASANLTFTTNDLGTFSALNTIQPGGIHPMPNQKTLGNGPITGEEVEFDVAFTTPFDLQPGHYFFVPQVEVTTTTGEFLWLSGLRPIVPPGTPFPAGVNDLQEWTRDGNVPGIEPDWLRVGTDIVGGGATAPTFNGAFTLSGSVPEPATIVLLGIGLAGLGFSRRQRK